MPECSYTNLHNYTLFEASSKCDFAQRYCIGDTTYINTISMYYCTLDESLPLIILISIPWLLLCFYWLSSTAEHYLEPSLSNAARAIQVSESLAGVTLIGFANGAPDIISAYAASQIKDDSGVNLAFGALFGASVFTTTIVLARVIQNSRNLQLSGRILLRDCGFYIAAEIYLFYLATSSKIDLLHGIVLFTLYVLYVMVIIYDEVQFKKAQRAANTQSLVPPGQRNGDFTEFKDEPHDPEVHAIELSVSNEKKLKVKSGKPSSPIDALEEVQHPLESRENLSEGFLASVFHILRWIEMPMNLIRDFTVPRVDDSPINRIRISLYPLLTGIFVLWQFGVIEKHGREPLLWAIYIASSFALGILLWFMTQRQGFLRVLTGVFVFISLIVAVMWVRVVADLVIDLLVLLKVASGLHTNFIGLTVLAWGNSASDFFVDGAIARKGHGVMAVSGILSGQFFNLQIGFGMLLLFNTGKVNLSLYGRDVDSWVNFILITFSLMSLVGTLIYGAMRKFRMKNEYAIIIILYYVLFCVIVSFVSFGREEQGVVDIVL